METINATTPAMGNPIRRISWEDVYEWVDDLCIPESKKVWGIPRGGAILAGLTRRMVDSPAQADIILDDIIDSGRTLQRYQMNYPNKEFQAMFDKRKDEKKAWVIFPWEGVDETKDIEDTVVRQLEFIGEDPNRDGLVETPKRVIRSLKELTQGYEESPATILSRIFEEPYDEMVVLRNIEFWSLCEHHILPFHGRVDLAYIPQGRIVGISKLARLVRCFSRRLQVQERMTQEIATAIQTHLRPQGVGVVVRASHLCMAMRGIKKPAEMVTSCVLGLMKEDHRARAEFLNLADHG